MVEKKLNKDKFWFYIPKEKQWMAKWLHLAVRETDVGLTQNGKPRQRTAAHWVWLLVEATLAERYFKVRKQLRKDGQEIPDLDTFLEE